MIIQENTKEKINSSKQVSDIFKCILELRQDTEKHKEYFYIMGLNSQNEILYIDLLTMGSINQCNPVIRECLRLSIIKDACSIIACHNHPSGNTQASIEDKNFTNELIKACNILNIKLLDHIIIGNGYLSFSDSGLLC